jgi:hypothetical protein
MDSDKHRATRTPWYSVGIEAQKQAHRRERKMSNSPVDFCDHTLLDERVRPKEAQTGLTWEYSVQIALIGGAH